MAITTLSSREFNQNTSRAKKAAADGPVFITDRGKPSHVLLSVNEYYNVVGQKPKSLLDVMGSMPGGDFDFEPPKLVIGLKPAEFN